MDLEEAKQVKRDIAILANRYRQEGASRSDAMLWAMDDVGRDKNADAMRVIGGQNKGKHIHKKVHKLTDKEKGEKQMSEFRSGTASKEYEAIIVALRNAGIGTIPTDPIMTVIFNQLRPNFNLTPDNAVFSNLRYRMSQKGWSFGLDKENCNYHFIYVEPAPEDVALEEKEENKKQLEELARGFALMQHALDELTKKL